MFYPRGSLIGSCSASQIWSSTGSAQLITEASTLLGLNTGLSWASAVTNRVLRSNQPLQACYPDLITALYVFIFIIPVNQPAT